MVAPSIRANARELERNMKKDSLNRSLTDRPEEQTLVDSGKMLGRTIISGELSDRSDVSEVAVNREATEYGDEEAYSRRESLSASFTC